MLRCPEGFLSRPLHLLRDSAFNIVQLRFGHPLRMRYFLAETPQAVFLIPNPVRFAFWSVGRRVSFKVPVVAIKV